MKSITTTTFTDRRCLKSILKSRKCFKSILKSKVSWMLQQLIDLHRLQPKHRFLWFMHQKFALP